MDKTPKRVESQQDKVEVSQKPFTEEERLSLLNNQYVSGVTNASVQFTEEFKELAYNEFRKSGKPMREIFKEHGIDPEILGSKRIWNFTSKLQEKAKKLQGFGDARTHNKRRPKCSPTEEKTLTERIRSLEHELAYTRQEVEFLKKNSDDRYGGSDIMGIQASQKVKFALIQDALRHSDNLLNVSMMCEIAGVSRSGYYSWCAAEDKRQAREEQDRRDFELILEAYQHRGYDKGIEGLYMRLLHMGIIMNKKKIRRLTRKFGLSCSIRKTNPYRKMMRNLQAHKVFPNFVNRVFKRAPRKVLLTDITYLFYNIGSEKRTCYLSAILDAFTHEILAYQVSESLKVDFVIKTVNELVTKHGYELDNETIVHSDQGVHYTSKEFIEKLKDAKFVQSMSRKANCWDNAPMESFFGHMKDEIKKVISKYERFEDVAVKVDDWIDYYNKDRGQRSLKNLTPTEFYQYSQTGVYPLPVYKKPEKKSE